MDGPRFTNHGAEGEVIFDAILFAARAHTSQFRKGTSIPYVVHSLNVAVILLEQDSAEEVVVAWPVSCTTPWKTLRSRSRTSAERSRRPWHGSWKEPRSRTSRSRGNVASST